MTALYTKSEKKKDVIGLVIYLFSRKVCSYSLWWITIKAKFFRLSRDHDVVTCDVDRDVSTP